MRAIRFHRTGEPDVLVLDEVPAPTPRAGEVLLRVRAVGINWADTRFRRGEYFVRPQFPQICGMEAAGEVLALGEGVTGLAVGDRVMALGENAYAEQMTARADLCYPMPAGLSFTDAAALPVQGLTAHHCLTLHGRMVPGDAVLVHAAAGGVGSLAVQLARRLGARLVLGTAGSDDKRALVRELGADDAIDYRAPDWVQRAKELSGGQGVDVILEMVGGTESYKRNLACLAPLGRLVVYGAANGDTRGQVEPIGLMHKNHTVTGYYLTPLLRRRDLCAPALAALAEDVVAGRVKVLVGALAPLADAARLHREMEARGTTGKLVLSV